jgi:aspartate aminotransferase
MSSLGMGTDDLADSLLDEYKVAVVPGSGFGAEGYIRLSYATSDDVIEKGVARLRDFCGNL